MHNATPCLAPAAGLPPVWAGAAEPPCLQLHDAADPGRADVERFIAGVYAQRFGARLHQFAPHLVSLRDPHTGAVVAAAGYRIASEHALFLERYLDAPVERLLEAGHGQPVSRQQVVEAGQLAASRAGEGRRLIRLLGQHFATLPVDWVVGTLTQELRHLFVRLGVTPMVLGQADVAAVGEDLPTWGSYYEHRPLVLAGRLQPALRLLGQRGRVPSAGGQA